MTKADEIAVRQELEKVLDAEHVQAVLDHRKVKKVALTPFAAKLLAAQFARWGDANAAADHMILRGWLAFKAEWAEPPKTSAVVSVHREPTRIPDRPEPPPEVRERNMRRLQALSAQLGAATLMDKPRHVQQRDRGR